MSGFDNEWIEWAGGECPVPAETLVETRHRSGLEITRDNDPNLWPAGRWHASLWTHGDDLFPPDDIDITAYRVVRA